MEVDESDEHSCSTKRQREPSDSEMTSPVKRGRYDNEQQLERMMSDASLSSQSGNETEDNQQKRSSSGQQTRKIQIRRKKVKKSIYFSNKIRFLK